VTYFDNVLDLLFIWGKGKAKNFKFGTLIDNEGQPRKKCKIRSKGVGKRSRDLLFEFWDPISRERPKQSSNLARLLTMRGSNEKMQNLVKGVGEVSRDLLLEC